MMRWMVGIAIWFGGAACASAETVATTLNAESQLEVTTDEGMTRWVTSDEIDQELQFCEEGRCSPDVHALWKARQTAWNAANAVVD